MAPVGISTNPPFGWFWKSPQANLLTRTGVRPFDRNKSANYVDSTGDESIPPRGSTVIQPGDHLFVLAPHSLRPAIEDVFARWRRRV